MWSGGLDIRNLIAACREPPSLSSPPPSSQISYKLTLKQTQIKAEYIESLPPPPPIHVPRSAPTPQFKLLYEILHTHQPKIRFAFRFHCRTVCNYHFVSVLLVCVYTRMSNAQCYCIIWLLWTVPFYFYHDHERFRIWALITQKCVFVHVM